MTQYGTTRDREVRFRVRKVSFRGFHPHSNLWKNGKKIAPVCSMGFDIVSFPGKMLQRFTTIRAFKATVVSFELFTVVSFEIPFLHFYPTPRKYQSLNVFGYFVIFTKISRPFEIFKSPIPFATVRTPGNFHLRPNSVPWGTFWPEIPRAGRSPPMYILGRTLAFHSSLVSGPLPGNFPGSDPALFRFLLILIYSPKCG